MGLNQAETKVRDAMSLSKSPQDIAEELGYPVEEVHKIQTKIFQSIDGYTLDQQLKLTIMDLRELGQMAKENYRIDANSRQAEAAVKAFDAAAGRIDAISKRVDDSIFKMNQEQALTLQRIVERSFDRLLGKLMERYPKIEQGDLEDEFRDLILESAKEADRQK